jgi:anti-sigma factor RsiW
MKQSLCDRLDDYMLDWLSPDETAAFERHLEDCPDCRREYALQKSIDGLLFELVGSPDAIPSGLIDRARNRVQRARRKRAMRWAFGLVGAAAVLLAVVCGQFTILHSNRSGGQDGAVSQNGMGTSVNEASNSPVGRLENLKASTRVALADPSSGIVLECKTRDPRINIVWIYSTVKSDTLPDE